MCKKALIVTTVCGFATQFEKNNIKLLKKMGYEIHYASNFNNPVYAYDKTILQKYGVLEHQVDFVRSPFKIKDNVKAYRQLKCILKQNTYDIIHCHTPMGGALTRLVARRYNTKVIYTAHGFHFFKGAPWINWCLFYPVERYLARFTDSLITINNEDFARAKKFKLKKGGNVEKVNGVGVKQPDNVYTLEDCKRIRNKLHILKNTFLLVSVGELTKRKNHETVIRAMASLKDKNIQYLICGSGEKFEELTKLIHELGLDGKVILAGYCSNIDEILSCANCFIFPSLQEGLSVALMEAMEMGLPIICSKIRGNIDLVKHGSGGYLIEKKDSRSYEKYILKLYDEYKKQELDKYGVINRGNIKLYDISYVEKQMKDIYTKLI